MVLESETPIDRFAQALRNLGFEGEIETGRAAREVLATDNSVYRIAPSAAIFPRRRQDIAIAVEALNMCGADGLSLTARGGGTGTNGQSLNDGIILDTSRHLTSIVQFDPVAGRVMVEPGVVLDQLNAFLAPHGWFFPPHVSTSSRATIGGMVATDASGKGSRHYGRTSDYIEALDIVLADGSATTIKPLDAGTIGDAQDALCADVMTLLETARPFIDGVFPKMNRGLTGYNLKEALGAQGGLNLCKILAGSEGTLALTSAITLSLRRKPAFSGLMVLFYDRFSKALAHVPKLVAGDPLAVEILDDKVLALARNDPVWTHLAALFGDIGEGVGAVNFIEVTGDGPEEVAGKLAAITTHLEGDDTAFLIKTVTARDAIGAAWSLRAKAVGLLGALEGQRRAYPFVEDTAVPPENLVAYIGEFRVLLDAHGVAYGMFGHADVGCLHVRPTLDMLDPNDRALVRTISDGVQALTRKYGGLIWGEHGRGVRGEYLEEVFGPELYPVVRAIKGLFDPNNRFNPGKLASPPGSERAVMRIDQVAFRGTTDAEIPLTKRAQFDRALACNGNGACHDWNPADAMCPSFKATRDKTQSPNGRSSLIRAWAREPDPEIEAALFDSLSTCLSCRSCATACPVKVDIPTMKSRFLDSYYRTHRRSLRDRIIQIMEPTVLLARHGGRLSNFFLHNPLSAGLIRWLGLVDLPRFSDTRLEERLESEGINRLDGSHAPLGERAVIVVPDSFLASFDPEPIVAAARVLGALGFVPYVAPVLANGKALEVRGFARAYVKARTRLQAALKRYRDMGVPVISIEPAVTVQARQDGADFLVALEVFLARHCPPQTATTSAKGYPLFLHCTEKSFNPQAGKLWQSIFSAHGISTEIIETGCCGMSGLFGHEAEHKEMSRRVYELSWSAPAAREPIMATGFSCRCQVKRFGQAPAIHPIQMLAKILDDRRRSSSDESGSA